MFQWLRAAAGLTPPPPATAGVFLGPHGVAVPQPTPEGPEGWYVKNVLAHVGVQRVIQAVGAIPWPVQELRGGLWVDAPEHPLARLLQYVNRRDNMYLLKVATAGTLLLRGNAYWQFAGEKPGGPPAALFTLPAHLTKPKPEGGFAYFPKGEGQEPIPYRDDEVLHFRQWNPTDPWFGLGDAAAADTELQQGWNAATLVNAILKAGGLQGIFTADRELDEAQEKRLLGWARKIVARFRGERVTVIGRNLKYEPIGQQVTDTLVKDVPDATRRAILAAFGCPPTMAGIGERASYAQAKVEAKVMYETIVLGLDLLMLATINTGDGLVSRFGDPARLRVWHTLDHITWLQEDLVTRVEAAAKFVSGFLGSVNEARAEFLNLGPRPGGDVILGPISTVVLQDAKGKSNTIEDVKASPPAPSPEGRGGTTSRRLPSPSGEGAGGEASLRRFGPEARLAIHRGYNGRRDREAAGLAKRIGGWYDDLGREVIAKLEAAADLKKDGRSAFGVRRSALTPNPEPRTPNPEPRAPNPSIRLRQPTVEALLFDVETSWAALEDIVAPVLVDLYARTGMAEMETVGAEISFDLNNPRAQALLEARGREMKTVAANAQDRARATLAEGLAEGETVTELTERMEEWMRAGREGYAENVARTETGIVMNEAAREADRQAGATGFEWLAIVDDRTRDSHADMDGVTRGLDESFDLNGTACEGPGDPALGAEDVCNCRCTTAAVFES